MLQNLSAVVLFAVQVTVTNPVISAIPSATYYNMVMAYDMYACSAVPLFANKLLYQALIAIAVTMRAVLKAAFFIDMCSGSISKLIPIATYLELILADHQAAKGTVQKLGKRRERTYLSKFCGTTKVPCQSFLWSLRILPLRYYNESHQPTSTLKTIYKRAELYHGSPVRLQSCSGSNTYTP